LFYKLLEQSFLANPAVTARASEIKIVSETEMLVIPTLERNKPRERTAETPRLLRRVVEGI
jgi:hypothetical protein